MLDGARQILMERFAEDAELLGKLRDYLQPTTAWSASTVIADKAERPRRRQVPRLVRLPRSHLAPCPRTGRWPCSAAATKASCACNWRWIPTPPTAAAPGPNPCEARIAGHFGIKDQGRPADSWLRETVRWAWSVKISLHLELELLGNLREQAEEEAIRVLAAT